MGGSTSQQRASQAGDPHSELLDWVIVGGGPHGVCAGRALVALGGMLRIVEPSGELLSRWNARAAEVDMTSMRSPASDHLDDAPVSLHHFLHRPEHADVATLAGVYRRPTLAAFQRHSQDVVDRHGLGQLVTRGRVDGIQPDGDHLLVEGEGVQLRSRRVLIATGSNTARVPAWAQRLRSEGAPVGHVFDGDAGWDHDLIGGGISAVQRALMVHRKSGKPVRIWTRSPIRVADFAFDKDWSKHRFAARWAELSEQDRLDFLGRYGIGGSVPGGLEKRLRAAVRRGSIVLKEEIPEVTWEASRRRLVLRGDSETFESEGITLVTGLEPERISGWLQDTADRLDLPTAQGLPRLSGDMHWGRGIHISGPLARLRLGPMASQIVGARWATSKLPGVRMQPV